MTADLAASWTQVAAFASALDADLDRWLSENYRLGLSEFRALALLADSPDQELRIAALAQSVGLTSTSTTRLVSRLAGKGLASRDVCLDDGRGVYAVMSESGSELLRLARGPFDARVDELLSNPQEHFPQFNGHLLGAAFLRAGGAITP